MNKNKLKVTLMTAAMAGMFLAGANVRADNHEHSKTSDHHKPVTGECHGVNACKGKGECGGKEHACAGKNSCKGHGWEKTTKEECEKKGGQFKS